MPGNAIAAIHALGKTWGLAAAILLAALLTGHSAAGASSFDYYVLALSWSPTYCLEDGAARGEAQCRPGRRFAFIVHGLWPQYERGWPEFCRARENFVPESEIEAMMGIMPSKRLVIHQWRKHGACSGLSIAQYFAATRRLFGKVRVPARYLSPQADVITTPDQLAADFVKTNRDLASSMLSVQCGNARGRARLSELRICIDRAGNFRHCGKNEARRCQAKTLVMPPVR